MLQKEFLNIIRKPIALTNDLVAELETIVAEYPFFETAHLLYAKGLKQQNSLQYAKQLRKAAIVANSRIVLHDLLHKTETVEQQITDLSKELAQSAPIEEKTIVQKEKEEIVERDITSNVTTTLTEVKVIYIHTPSKIEHQPEELAAVIASKSTEIELLQRIENETEPQHFDIDKLNQTIEQEISRGIIQSFVETDILKTQELDKTTIEEPLSFTAWLTKIKKEAHTIQKNEPTKEKNNPPLSETHQKSPNFNQNRQIIDKVIESDPGKLKLGNNKFFTPNLDAKQSLLENEHLVTETLAKIYALQGNVNKAIRSYEILSLKFPQKSVYFATLIQNLKNNK